MKERRNKIKKIIGITNSIDGWLSIQEGVFLYKLAGRLGENTVVVEIGSWHGKSTIWLASAIKDKKNANLYAVDPHRGSPEKDGEFNRVNTFDIFNQNIQRAGVAEKIIPLRKTSLRAAATFPEKADIVFIDGSHLFADVKKDFFAWKKKLKRGGWIVLHDATVLPGPWRVAKNYLLKSTDFIRPGMLGSMVFGQYYPNRNLPATINTKLRNLLAYLFIISYVKMRKIPLSPKLKKNLSKLYFRRKIAEI